MWDAFVGDLPFDPLFEDVQESIPPVVAARVLGHGLRYAPNGIGCDALVRYILVCVTTFGGVCLRSLTYDRSGG